MNYPSEDVARFDQQFAPVAKSGPKYDGAAAHWHACKLAQALRELADAAEAEARGDDSVPMHLRCLTAADMATRIIAARAALAEWDAQ